MNSGLTHMILLALRSTLPEGLTGISHDMTNHSMVFKLGIWNYRFYLSTKRLGEPNGSAARSHQSSHCGDTLTAKTSYLRQHGHLELAGSRGESDYTHRAPWGFWHLSIQDEPDTGLVTNQHLLSFLVLVSLNCSWNTPVYLQRSKESWEFF